MMKVLKKEKFPQIWQAINQAYELYLPIEKDGRVNFAQWTEGEKVNLEALKTEISPKDVIFPQSETYLKFESDGKKLQLESVESENREYVLFGVRPCDAVSFNLIDNVFLREPIDRLYETRRNKGTIVSIACSEPEEYCFCSSFQIKPEEAPPGVDVAAWDLEDKILWKPVTEKGQVLTQKLAQFMENASQQDQEELINLQNAIKEKVKELPLASVDPKVIKGELKEIFESKVWDELSQSCLGCGACTYICPTCHCYDIQDFAGGNCGERFRCWDSCMFSEFTLMAHGNPRTTQKQRFRQRFMHKLVYYPNNHGSYACVGCGRCIEKCPVNMNIVKVIKRLGGEG